MAGDETKTRKQVCEMQDDHCQNVWRDEERCPSEKSQGTAWPVGFHECSQGKEQTHIYGLVIKRTFLEGNL